MDGSDRYSRQVLLSQLGEGGQRRLSSARAVVVGCGALGTVHASLLVRAGVGEAVLVDRDYVEASNLQRQLLFGERDVQDGTPKAVAAARSLRLANSAAKLVPVVRDLTPSNAEELLSSATVILDGTDNYETRFLINDVAVKHSVPWVYGAAVGTQGSCMPVLPGRTACLACMFPSPPGSRQPTCDTAGVLNAVTTLIGSLQVAEALKILAGREEDILARLVSHDLWSGERSSVRADEPDPQCRACARRQFTYLAATDPKAARVCGRDAVQVPGGERALDLGALARSLATLGEVRCSEQVVRFRCPPHELTVFEDGRTIVKGTLDPGVARSLHARYVGI